MVEVAIPKPEPINLAKELDAILRAKEEEKARLRPRMPKPGAVWNPLLNYPRNQLCFCNSQKKFKKCCYLKIADKRAINAEDAAKVNAALKGKI